MRHEINSYNTKCTLAGALKELVARGKGKVTVNEIIQLCGVSKNTFYYHFPDLAELILWTLKHDFYSNIRAFDSSDGRRIREFVIHYFSHNGKFLNYAYQYIGFDGCWDCYNEELVPIISDYIDYLDGIYHWQVSLEGKAFFSRFCAKQVSSIYLMQFRRPDRYQEQEALRYLELIFDYAIPDMLAHERGILRGIEGLPVPEPAE